MLVLGFESSCDETGVALVSTTEGVLAHALHSQVAMHEEYGGVVPELASRDHIKHIYPLTKQVLSQANVRLEEVDLIAYTAGPGLAGALLVGASFAQSIAMALQKPAVPIHHLEGHLLSPLLAVESPSFPFIALLVSGGHTQLMRVEKVGKYELLGETLDDAAGEAFDKSAKLLGLGYPGGPALAALAEKGNPDAIALPRPKMHSPDLDFSFSGLKTAVRTYIQKQDSPIPEQVRADIAAATQQAIVDVLVKKSLQALEQTGINTLVVAGGVGANRYLRQQLQAAQLAKGYQVYFPPIDLCTDNGAMIAFAAALRLQNGLASLEQQPYAFSVYPRWDLEEYTKQAF